MKPLDYHLGVAEVTGNASKLKQDMRKFYEKIKDSLLAAPCEQAKLYIVSDQLIVPQLIEQRMFLGLKSDSDLMKLYRDAFEKQSCIKNYYMYTTTAQLAKCFQVVYQKKY